MDLQRGSVQPFDHYEHLANLSHLFHVLGLWYR